MSRTFIGYAGRGGRALRSRRRSGVPVRAARRCAIVIGFSLGLAGWACGTSTTVYALPSALTLVSFGADGVSYAAAGKSVSDVALSAATDQDCALFRAVLGRPVCDVPAAAGERPAIVVDRHASRTERAITGAFGGNAPMQDVSWAFSSSAGNLASPWIFVTGFAAGTELFGLVQQDGALEIFVQEPSRDGSRSQIVPVARVTGYADRPATLKGIRLNGVDYRVGEILI